MKRATAIAALAGGAALVFLVVMVITGARPEQRQYVKFEAKGVMQLPPEQITRVALRVGTRTAVLVRTADNRWLRENGEPLGAAAGKRLSMAVQFMNTSEPVRVLEPGDLTGTDRREFGLDQPHLSIVLFEGERQVIGAQFCGRNPDGMLQYVALEGRRELYLLSRFVGEEWDAAAKAALGG